jgi:hypothetical protein
MRVNRYGVAISPYKALNPSLLTCARGVLDAFLKGEPLALQVSL